MKFTDEQAQEVIDNAGYGMVGWAHTAHTHQWRDDSDLTFVEVGDGDEEVVHHLTYADIKRAFYKVHRGFVRIRSDLHDQFNEAVREGEPGLIDSDCADIVVQVAAFGEVRYG